MSSPQDKSTKKPESQSIENTFVFDVTDLLGEIVTKMTDPHNQLLSRLHQTGHVSDSDLVRLEQEVLERAAQVAEEISGRTLLEFLRPRRRK